MRLLYLFIAFLATAARCQEYREALFNDVVEFEITHSDDDMDISLPSFSLAIYPIYRTDGSLPDDAITEVGGAMNNFVLARLNALYSPIHSVKSISTQISKLAYDEYDELRRLGIKEPTRQERIGWEMAHGAADTPYDERKLLRGQRRLDILPGIVMEMKVNVTFDRQPAPSEVDVAEALKDIMQDLSDYVADLRAVNDGDLSGVKYAFRFEILPPSAPPTNTPTVASAVPLPASPTKPSPFPTGLSTNWATASPTDFPTDWPTNWPTASASATPTVSPIVQQTSPPTAYPTVTPTMSPITSTTAFPIGGPTPSVIDMPTNPNIPIEGMPGGSDGEEPAPTSAPAPSVGVPSSSPPTEGSSEGSGGEPTISSATDSPVSFPSNSPPTEGSSGGSGGGQPSTPSATDPTVDSPSSGPTEASGGSDGGEPTTQTATDPTLAVPSSSPPPDGSGGGQPSTPSGNDPTVGGGGQPSTPSATDPTVDAPSSSPTEASGGSDGGEPTTPTATDPTLAVPSSSPPPEGSGGSGGGQPSTPSANDPTVGPSTEQSAGGSDDGSTNNVTEWNGGSGPDDDLEPDNIAGLNGPQDPVNESDNTALVASLISAGAAVVVVAGLLAYRRHRQHLNGSGNGEFLCVASDLDSVDPSVTSPASKPLEVDSDLESSNSCSITPSSQMTSNTENVDSVFAGLDSPYLKKSKSLSSASTVRANNFHGATPRSTTNASVSLFAFSEEESVDENIEIVNINLSDIASESDRYSPSYKEPVNAMTQEHLFITTEDGYQVATPMASPASYSQLMDTGDEEWKPPTSDPNGALIAVGVIGAATTAAAVAMARRRSDESDTDGSFPRLDDTDADISRRYHAAYQGEGDGTMVYQTAAAGHMPDTSDDDSTGSHQNIGSPAVFHNGEKRAPTPTSALSSLSGSVQTSASKDTDSSQFSASRQLINDLVWLEKKIADVRSSAVNTSLTIKSPDRTIDSLSTISNFRHNESPTSDDAIRGELVKQSVVCRDVQVPPGKLNVVIHSTNDGPAIYSVSDESALADRLFPGDLITSVDSVDTRNLSAEQVLHMMIEKKDVERKITVLHCE